MRRRAGLLGALSLGIAPFAALAGETPGDPFTALASSLAAAMRRAAGALRARHRRDATEALDRARRLTRFADGIRGPDAETSAAFDGAQGAVEQARHALQNGRADDASAILSGEAGRLDATSFPRGASSVASRAIARGSTVLDLSGNVIGTTVGDGEDGEVELELGGLMGFGAVRRRVPVTQLIAGRDEVMLLGGEAPWRRIRSST